MEEASIKKIKRKELINRIVFIVLCCFIGILLVLNAVLITNAYFTNSKSSSPSIVTSGDIEVALVNDLGAEIVSPISLGTSVMIPGNQTEYTLNVKNTGRNKSYIRLKMDVEIDNEPNTEIVEMRKNSNTLFELGDYIYYNAEVSPNQTVEVPVKFVISPSLGNMDSEGNSYVNVSYSIRVTVYAIQSAGVTLSTTNGWVY